MKYWTVHVSVLRDLVSIIPGLDFACIDFIVRISREKDEGIALDHDELIIGDYENLKDNPVMKTSSLYSSWMKDILTIDRKTHHYSSALNEKYKRTLQAMGVINEDMVYFGVATNADKLLAHSKKFTKDIIDRANQLLEIVAHDIPKRTWRRE